MENDFIFICIQTKKKKIHEHPKSFQFIPWPKKKKKKNILGHSKLFPFIPWPKIKYEILEYPELSQFILWL